MTRGRSDDRSFGQVWLWRTMKDASAFLLSYRVALDLGCACQLWRFNVIELPSRAAHGPTAHVGRDRSINGRAVRSTLRWVVGIVIVVRGSIHLLGAAKGLGWADVSRLADPISRGIGATWLAAAVVTIAAGALLLARVRWWWVVGVSAIVISQAVIVMSWTDAKVGTIANVIMLGAVVYGCASKGPRSGRAEYRRRAGRALEAPRSLDLVTEADLAQLPASVAAYVRQAGAVGQPRV